MIKTNQKRATLIQKMQKRINEIGKSQNKIQEDIVYIKKKNSNSRKVTKVNSYSTFGSLNLP